MKIKRALKIDIIYVAILLTVLSQIRSLSPFLRPFMFITWIILFGDCLFQYKNELYLSKTVRTFLVMYFFFIVFKLSCSFFNSLHIEGNYLKIMLIPLLVSIVGNNTNNEKLRMYKKIYIISAFCLALWVNIVYFPSYTQWLKTSTYVYTSKNSAAQIWGSAILLLFEEYRGKNIKVKICIIILAIYLLLLCGMCRCRTAILALLVISLIYVLKGCSLKKLLFVCLSVIIFYHIPAVQSFFEQAFLLKKYAGADLNTFSSDRIQQWEKALNVFKDNIIIGYGMYYTDCSYISILAENGMVGFVLIESIWLTRVVENYKHSRGNSFFVMAITIFYLVESALEGFPPFGPGACSFMFWLLSSMYDRNTLEANYG